MYRYRWTTAVREGLILVVAFAILVPFYLLVNVAIKSTDEALDTSPATPAHSLSLQGFAEALAGGGLLNGMLNSLIITAGSIAALVAIGSLTAYALATTDSRWGELGYLAALIGIILPFQLGLLPTYIAMRNLHLIGTHIGMIILYTGMFMPFTVFLYAGFARGLPREYEEAAWVDGASRFQTFTRVVFPLLAPATGTVAIMNGLAIWNDFFNSLIFLSGSKIPTLTIAIYAFAGGEVSRWNVIFSGLIVAILPMLIFYLFAQRQFIQGFAGGIKS